MTSARGAGSSPLLLCYQCSKYTECHHTTQPYKQHEAHRTRCVFPLSASDFFLLHSHCHRSTLITRLTNIHSGYARPTRCFTLLYFRPFLSSPIYRKVFTVFVFIPISRARWQGFDSRYTYPNITTISDIVRGRAYVLCTHSPFRIFLYVSRRPVTSSASI